MTQLAARSVPNLLPPPHLFFACAVSVLASVATAADVYVDAATGIDQVGGGTQAAPFKTIGFGLAQSGPGDRVLVAAGVYDAQLGESFPITLRDGDEVVGLAPGQVIVRGTLADDLFTLWEPVGFWSNGDVAATLRHLVLEGGYAGVRVAQYDAEAELEAESLIIRGCSRGISLEGGGSFLTSSGVQIERCTFEDLDTALFAYNLVS